MTANSHPSDTLIGDIGGTNARFQIVTEKGEIVTFDPVKTADFTGIEQAIDAVLSRYTGSRPQAVILAAAGPIEANGLDLTNADWSIDATRFLQQGLWQELVLMNDFEAQALALPFLGKDDFETIGTAALLDNHSKAAVGPGTGLGVGNLVRADGKWIPVAGEGGHVDLGPRTVRETTIWAYLERVDGRISAEQVLSGDGLENLYRAICHADKKEPHFISAVDISSMAMESDNGPAQEALGLFCTLLGRVAGDLALTSMAKGGIYVSGGIARQILPFIETSGFRSAFDDKAPHSALMQSIGTAVVTHPLPALLGLAAYARNPGDFLFDIDHRRWNSK